MTDTVRNPVLSRYFRLNPVTREVLPLIATGGVAVPHRVAAHAFQGDPAVLDGAAREAVQVHILVRDPGDYVFRHALLREAILEDCVPGERARNHAQFAAALSERPEGQWAEIAQHWMAAHDTTQAFAATIKAIPEARAVGALGTAAALGEQALDLWPQVPDAAQIAGVGRDDVVTISGRSPKR